MTIARDEWLAVICLVGVLVLWPTGEFGTALQAAYLLTLAGVRATLWALRADLLPPIPPPRQE